MGELRRTSRALRARGFFYYFHDAGHQQKGVIAFRREAPAEGEHQPTERLVVVLNFSDADQRVWIPFSVAGTWHELIDGLRPSLRVTEANQWTEVTVPSNYGSVYALVA
jgi:glycosidase